MNEWLGGSNKILIPNGACGVPGRPPQYEALTVLTGAMAQRTFCFSEALGRSSSVSSMRLNKSGIMDMLTLKKIPIWIRFMRYTQNTSVVRPWRFSNHYQFGLYVAVQFMLEVEICDFLSSHEL